MVTCDYVYCVGVTGGRTYGNTQRVYDALDTMLLLYGPVMLVHGACPTGADFIAEQWAKARQQIYIGFPAEWDKYGRRAGMKRNAEMAAMGGIKRLLVFEGQRGTLNMLSTAHGLEIPVWLVDGEFWK